MPNTNSYKPPHIRLCTLNRTQQQTKHTTTPHTCSPIAVPCRNLQRIDSVLAVFHAKTMLKSTNERVNLQEMQRRLD
ncbi:MAG TPA: hypothetical protein VGB11_01535 [Candidatus Bathyarchaeia archaeon]